MTGILLFLALALILLAAFWIFGVRGPRFTIVAAALALGGAGYVFVGSPGTPSDLRQTATRQPPLPLTGARQAFFGQFNASDYWMRIAEGYASRGKTSEAAKTLSSAVRERPRNFALWTSYGNALVDDADTMTPAAQYAFQHAIDMAPDHPGPRFFYALAKMRTGDPQAARADLETILENASAEAEWRPLVTGALSLLNGETDQAPTGS